MFKKTLTLLCGGLLLCLLSAPARANMPYPGYLCQGKDEGASCSYMSSHGTCVPDPNPPDSCTGNNSTGTKCIWCEFDPNSEEGGCSVAQGASLTGMGGLLALGLLTLLARRQRQRRER